jgi:hypothetical protein
LSLKLLRPLLKTHSFSTELSFEFNSPPEFEGPVEYNLEATNVRDKGRKEGRKGRKGGREGRREGTKGGGGRKWGGRKERKKE